MSKFNTNNPVPLACQQCPLWRWVDILKRRLSVAQLASAVEEWELILEQSYPLSSSSPSPSVKRPLPGVRHER